MKPRTSLKSAIKDRFISLDRFQETIQFNINKKSAVQTIFGSLLSILMLAQLANYSYIKFQVFKHREDTQN